MIVLISLIYNNKYHFFQNTIDEWQNIFLVGAVFYIVAACSFILFGNADVQAWDSTGEIEKDVDMVSTHSESNSTTQIVLGNIEEVRQRSSSREAD